MQCGYINDGYKGHIPTDKSYIVISQLLGVIATRFYLQFRKPVLHQFDLQNRWDPLGLILWKDPFGKIGYGSTLNTESTTFTTSVGKKRHDKIWPKSWRWSFFSYGLRYVLRDKKNTPVSWSAIRCIRCFALSSRLDHSSYTVPKSCTKSSITSWSQDVSKRNHCGPVWTQREAGWLRCGAYRWCTPGLHR